MTRVASCGVGYVDSLVALGRYHVKSAIPFIPAREVAGINESVDETEMAFSQGDRVFALS